MGLSVINAQNVADFEDIELGVDTFLNGIEGSGGYVSNGVFFPNLYDDAFGAWVGWAVSNERDDTTAGFFNQYSSIAASGAENSKTFAVANAYNPVILTSSDDGLSISPVGLFVSNSTYAALSMENGDAFAKKFGGESGNDPDYFLLTIKVRHNGHFSGDSVNVYLADYRFENNDEDYILKDWEYVDLSGLFPGDSLEFSLSSSDVGMFGMNTPAYFCMDNFSYETAIISTKDEVLPSLDIWPNPATDMINIELSDLVRFEAEIYNIYGEKVMDESYISSEINVSELPIGAYFIKISSNSRKQVATFVKI